MKSRQTDNYFPAKTPRRETLKMLMLLSCKFCCLSYMTFLAAILDAVVQYLREVSVQEYEEPGQMLTSSDLTFSAGSFTTLGIERKSRTSFYFFVRSRAPIMLPNDTHTQTANRPQIDLLAILKRIRIERYFATFCRIFECVQW